ALAKTDLRGALLDKTPPPPRPGLLRESKTPPLPEEADALVVAELSTIPYVAARRERDTLTRLHAQGGPGPGRLARDPPFRPGPEGAKAGPPGPPRGPRPLRGRGAPPRSAGAPRRRPRLRVGPAARRPAAVLHHALHPGPHPQRRRRRLPRPAPDEGRRAVG